MKTRNLSFLHHIQLPEAGWGVWWCVQGHLFSHFLNTLSALTCWEVGLNTYFKQRPITGQTSGCTAASNYRRGKNSRFVPFADYINKILLGGGHQYISPSCNFTHLYGFYNAIFPAKWTFRCVGEKQMHAYESKENMKFLAEPNWQSPSFLPHGHNEIAMFEVNDIILCTHN